MASDLDALILDMKKVSSDETKEPDDLQQTIATKI